MQIEPTEADIWHSNLTLAAHDLTVAQTLLQPDEFAKAQRFRFAKHRDRYIAARASLRTILSFYLDIPAKDILFTYDTNGKPFVYDSPIHFNLSHSEDLAVYAISRHDVGIDIEHITAQYEPAIATRYFAPDEVLAITSLPDEEQATRFYQIWSRKEAIIKACASSIFASTNEFTTLTDELDLTGKTWRLVSLTIHPHYAATVAVGKQVSRLRYWTLSNTGPKLQNIENIVIY